MSPTLRNRQNRIDLRTDHPTRTPRQPRHGTNLDLSASASVSRIMDMFLRRCAKAEKVTPAQLRIKGKPILLTYSRLGLKRRMDGKHPLARQFRKLTKGVCGALSWSDFDKLPVDSKGNWIMPESPRNRLAKAQEEHLRANPKGSSVKKRPRAQSSRVFGRRMHEAEKKRLTVRVQYVNDRHFLSGKVA